MNVTGLQVKDFRNIVEGEFIPCDGVNVIWGENAQGKTNLLEAIWMFTGTRSFRGAKEAQLIRFTQPTAELSLSFYGEGRPQEARLFLGDKRGARLNGVTLPSVGKLAGAFHCVVFSPAHLSLIKDGPGERRRFIDGALSQIRPKYHAVLSEYLRALQQRNILLRDVQYHRELMDTLDVWEERLAQYGVTVTYQRAKYIERLAPFAQEVFCGLSGGSEELSLEFAYSIPYGSMEKEEMKDLFRMELKNRRKQDLLTGSTSVGPHRDDLTVGINGLSARTYGSQGQQRSCVLALKLGEASLLREFSGEQPVALLDDVMSELDAGRQDYILHHIAGWQVFLTCCDRETVSRLRAGKALELRHGVLLP